MSPCGPGAGAARTARAPWVGKNVVLGVCGGIAAYKVVQVARDLTLLGATVDVVLTESAAHFVGALSFEGVTGRRPHTRLFSAPGAALHVKLAREADCVCVVPATADFIARTAQGRATDLLGNVLLATRAPVLFAPAMNHRMFAHPQVRTNVARLEKFLGYHRVGPADGLLAAGEGSGPGRMADPDVIIEALSRLLHDDSGMRGARVLVTAGSTREAVDPVRFMGNRSSGKMGFALARAAWRRGAEVTLVTGPSSQRRPYGVDVVCVETAIEMRDAVLDKIGRADLAVHAAAVVDYRPAGVRADKIKRSQEGSGLTLTLEANPDIAAEAGAKMKPGSVAVGFALETSNLLDRARAKLVAKGFDFIVANRAGRDGEGFEADTNRVTILTQGLPPRELPLMSKDDVAEAVLDAVVPKIENRSSP